MVGFVAAGLGLLGLRPLDRAISPLLVLSSGLSLVAIVRFADPGLWFGAACDVALLMIGLWRAYGGWPKHPAHGRIWHVTGLMAGLTPRRMMVTIPELSEQRDDVHAAAEK
jgi:hypothetical protein